jgi:aspartate kinase
MSPLSPLIIPQSGHVQPAFNVTVDLIRSEHINAAKACIQNPEILQDLEAEINQDCDWLRSFLFAAQVRSFYLTVLYLNI